MAVKTSFIKRLRSCCPVIKRFGRTISVYLCLIIKVSCSDCELASFASLSKLSQWLPITSHA